MNEAINELAEWALKELPGSRRDAPYLRRFLHGCKMRQDIARSKMKNFYKLQEDTPQWFKGRDPQLPHLSHLLDLGVFLPLEKKDPNGSTIIIVRATINNPRTHPMTDVFKVGMMVLDAAMEEDESISEHGVVVLIDMDQVSMYHAPQMTPNLIRRAVHSWQNCYPIQIKAIHFLNCPYHVYACLSIFKKFMRKKLQDRVEINGRDYSKIFNRISRDLLPLEYGGRGGSIQDTLVFWRDYTKAKREWFLHQELANACQRTA